MEFFFFYVLTTMLLGSAFMVIRVEHAVHAVLYLVLVFCSNSALLFFLGVEFLGLLLLVIYIGAIAILFLFVVMMLTIKEKKQHTLFQDIPIGFLIGLFLFLAVFYAMNQQIFIFDHMVDFETMFRSLRESYTYAFKKVLPQTRAAGLLQKDIEGFGVLLYDVYFFNVLIAGLILLVALVGAVTLASETDPTHRRRQYIYQQLSRQIKNAVVRVKS